MESAEPEKENEELPNSGRNGILEENFTKGIPIHVSPSTEERRIDANDGREESEKVMLPIADSPVNEENEMEIPNFENRPRLVQLPESLTDPVHELKSQDTNTKKETHPEFWNVHPPVDDKEEMSTSEELLTSTNIEGACDINHRESQVKVPKHEEQAVQNVNNVNVTRDNGVTDLKEATRRFPKNPSYHGTGRLPCPSLGDGWTIEQIVRQQGKSAGRYDTYYYSPLGAKIRSKLKLRECVKVDLTNFDYNSGKFIETGQVVISPKPKMSLLKTKELKTIDRSTENNLNSPPSKQSKKLLIKLPPRKKLFPGVCSSTTEKKKLTKKARKRKLPSSSTAGNVVAIDDDSSQNNPFEVFKMKALGLSSHFEDMKDYDDLIQFAWNFLSIESKTRFNDIFAPQNSNEPPSGESLEKCSRLEENDISTAASNSAVPQNSLDNRSHTVMDISIAPQYLGDLNTNQEGSTPSDNKVAGHPTQKPHKRKSRVPVYIKQHPNGNAD